MSKQIYQMQIERYECWRSESSISQVLALLLERIDKQIQEKQAIKQIPNFLIGIIMQEMYETNFPIVINHENKEEMIEENCSTIPKIDKDNLTPKYVNKQKDQSENTSIKTSTLNLKQISSIAKKNSTTSRTMKSVTFTEKRSFREKKGQTLCQMLQPEQYQQDNQIERLRQKTQLRFRYDLQYLKLNLFRQKSFRQKSKMLDDLLVQQPQAGITHDYEGEQLKSSIVDDKIKHYSMKAQFGTMMKRKKQQQFNKPVQMSIDINKNQKQKDFANKLVKPMQMPLFPVDHKDFSHLHEIKNYKLHDYKKHFGRKYSRLDQYSQTLQLSNLHKEDHKQEIFSERKHLRDSSLLDGSRESVQVKGHPRRLALPRLHGKYKVLDRYDEA